MSMEFHQVHVRLSPAASPRPPTLKASPASDGRNAKTDRSLTQPFQSAQFDIFDWHPKFLSCLRYFLDHAQHQGPVQAVAEFVNIQLPFQQNPSVSRSNNSRSPAAPGPSSARAPPGAPPMASIAISLIPYIRRLVVTGFDTGPVLHGFFGDDWHQGIGPIHETERRNYLFAAKSDTWVRVKAHYDMPDGQTVPFMVPLQNVTEEEIQSAERYWSNWLAMQDWMLGPRAPDNSDPRIKSERR